MFIFNRSFWTVGAGLGTALAILAASFLLDRPAAAPKAAADAAASSAKPQMERPAS
jgi:hypothetical protein